MLSNEVEITFANIMKTTIRKYSLCCLLLVLIDIKAKAQLVSDTLRISVTRAEALFLEKNLLLLAEKLEIDQADARILQAKAWPNPNFSLGEINLWKNSSTEASPPIFGSFGRNQQFAAQLEQLLLTARKRKKNIAYEVKGKELAQRTFVDFLQSIKTEFRKEVADLIYRQELSGDLQQQYALVSDLLRAQSAQHISGNISQAELMRMKALQLALLHDVNTLGEEIGESQQYLKTLMVLDPNTYLVLQQEPPQAYAMRRPSLDSLMRLSASNNAQLQMAESVKGLSQASLAIERAKKVPDLSVNINYDRNGSTMLNFWGIGLSMDLPLFDRNKGHIRAAEMEVKKADFLWANKRLETSNALAKKWQDLQRAVNLYEQMDMEYIDKLSGISQGVGRNFLARNISLLEFLDFFESFRKSKEHYYLTIRNMKVYQEELNYLTGSSL